MKFKFKNKKYAIFWVLAFVLVFFGIWVLVLTPKIQNQLARWTVVRIQPILRENGVSDLQWGSLSIDGLSGLKISDLNFQYHKNALTIKVKSSSLSMSWNLWRLLKKDFFQLHHLELNIDEIQIEQEAEKSNANIESKKQKLDLKKNLENLAQHPFPIAKEDLAFEIRVDHWKIYCMDMVLNKKLRLQNLHWEGSLDWSKEEVKTQNHFFGVQTDMLSLSKEYNARIRNVDLEINFRWKRSDLLRKIHLETFLIRSFSAEFTHQKQRNINLHLTSNFKLKELDFGAIGEIKLNEMHPIQYQVETKDSFQHVQWSLLGEISKDIWETFSELKKLKGGLPPLQHSDIEISAQGQGLERIDMALAWEHMRIKDVNVNNFSGSVQMVNLFSEPIIDARWESDLSSGKVRFLGKGGIWMDRKEKDRKEKESPDGTLPIKIEGSISLNMAALLGGQSSGIVKFPFYFFQNSQNIFHLDSKLILQSVRMSMPTWGVENANGEIPIFQEIHLHKKGIFRWAKLKEYNPFTRTNYLTMRPLLDDDSVKMDRVWVKEWEGKLFKGSLLFDQNIFHIQQFDVRFSKGLLNGEFWINLDPNHLSLGVLARSIDISMNEFLKTRKEEEKEEKKGEEEETAGFESRLGLVADLNSEKTTGRIDISKLSYRDYYDLLYFMDPKFEDSTLNKMRSALTLAYPEKVTFELESGFANFYSHLKGKVNFDFRLQKIPIPNWFNSQWRQQVKNYKEMLE